MPPIIESRFLRWACGLCGLALTAISVSLTATFGASISTNTALAVGIVSFLVGISPAILLSINPYAQQSNLIKWTRNAGIALLSIGVPFDVITNASTSAVDRTRDLSQATFQTASFSNVEKQIVATRKDIETWKANVADLKTKHSWAASATYDAKRVEVERLEQLAQAEGSKGRGGCGRLCRQYEAQAAAERAKLPALESKKDYTTRIAAAERKLANLLAERKATPPKVSSANEQNRRLASIFTAQEKPSAIVMFVVDNIVSIFVGLLITGFGMLFTTIGFLSGRGLDEIIGGTTTHAITAPAVARETTPPRPVPNQATVSITTIADLIRDNMQTARAT